MRGEGGAIIMYVPVLLDECDVVVVLVRVVDTGDTDRSRRLPNRLRF